MPKKPTCEFTREDMRVIEFLLKSLMQVKLDRPKDHRSDFFLQEMRDQGWSLDDSVRRAELDRMRRAAEGTYEREFCAR